MSVRVLVVEDNEMNLRMMRRRLAQRGFQVVGAADGQEALDRVRSDRPDVVLLDLSLPVIDGWEVARRLKADPETSAIPLIALTAHAMPTDRSQALDAGCDDYLAKPVDLTLLLTRIQVAVKGMDDA